MMTKLDLKKTLKDLYNPSAKTVLEVLVPPMNFIMVDGAGDPNNMAEFQPRAEVLYALAYTLKFGVPKLAVKRCVVCNHGIVANEIEYFFHDSASLRCLPNHGI